MNSFNVIGRMVRDPELRTTTSGTEIAKFTIAVDRKFKSKDGTTADFIKSEAWGPLASVIGQYLTKGRQAGFSGWIKNNDFTDKNGNKHYSYIFVVENMTFCGNKNMQDQENDIVDYNEISDEDLPF